jgi:hypothetical protein
LGPENFQPYSGCSYKTFVRGVDFYITKKKTRMILLILDFKLGTVDNRKDYLQTWGEFFFFIILFFLYKNRNTGFSSRNLLRVQKFCRKRRILPKFASNLFDCRPFPIWNLKLKESFWFFFWLYGNWYVNEYTLLHWKGKCTECIVIDSVISHAKQE